jgi:hypothetical protein
MENRQLVEITIKKDGSFTFEAKEGFAGESCRDKTRELEIVLGGEAVGSKNTPGYYDDGGDMNVNLNL